MQTKLEFPSWFVRQQMLKNDMNSLGEVDTTKKKLKFF